jgi:hypothetical protein
MSKIGPVVRKGLFWHLLSKVDEKGFVLKPWRELIQPPWSHVTSGLGWSGLGLWGWGSRKSKRKLDPNCLKMAQGKSKSPMEAS